MINSKKLFKNKKSQKKFYRNCYLIIYANKEKKFEKKIRSNENLICQISEIAN